MIESPTLAVSSTQSAAPMPAAVADDRRLMDILVIDDDESVRSMILEILRRNGYSFESASDGRTALTLLARHEFRLVITDIFMPDMDGLELIMKYTASNPNALILAISGGCRGNFADSSLKPARLLGSRRTLAKPFGVKEFLTTVREMLGPAIAA